MTHYKTSDHKLLPIVASLVMLFAAPALRADDFLKVSYDAATDELVILIDYSGTNPDHQFALNWGECQTKDDHEHEIFGDLIDQQGRDAARQDFHKTLRFSVADLPCRPATVTLRTAPRFFATVTIPAARSR